MQSMSDGTVSPDNSTGIPYFYVSPLDTSMIDIAADNSTSITISEEMINSDCSSQKVDPESPLCARLTLTGHMVPVPTASEQAQARAALFSRHPVMSVSLSSFRATAQRSGQQVEMIERWFYALTCRDLPLLA